MRVLAVGIAAVVLAGCAAIRPSPWVLWRETFQVNGAGKFYGVHSNAAAPVKTFDSLWACANDAERSTFIATGFVPQPPMVLRPVTRHQLEGGWQWAAERIDMPGNVVVQGYRCLPPGIIWRGMNATLSDFPAR